MKIIIYLLEDDPSIQELIRYNLELDSYEVKSFSSGEELLVELERSKEAVALFILDVMLPGMSGFEVCQAILTIPYYKLSSFLYLTARAAEEDKLQAFDLGADDYLTKPFGMRELKARVKALTDRYLERISLLEEAKLVEGSELAIPTAGRSDLILFGQIKLDHSRHSLYVADQPVNLTKKEYDLLYFLMSNPEIAFSREALLDKVWGYDYSGETRTVDVHIRQLRLKIEPDPANPQYLETVRGLGYRFNRGGE